MKIALCFSGNIQFLHECYPNIQKYLIDNNDVDVYAHLWWDEAYKGKLFRFHSAHRFDNRDLDKEFIELYKPKKCIFEMQRKFVDLSQRNENYDMFEQIVYFNLLSQNYSKMKSFELCYESGINYDVIVQLRVDCVVDEGRYLKDTLQQYDLSQLYMASTMEGGPKYCGHFPNEPSDWFYLGPPEKMKIFVELMYEQIYCTRKKKALHISDWLDVILKVIEQPLLLIDSGTSVHRPPTMFSGSDVFIPPHHYRDNFDIDKKEWKDLNNPYLPYYARFINFKEIKCSVCGNDRFDVYNNTVESLQNDIYRMIYCKSCKNTQLFPSIDN